MALVSLAQNDFSGGMFRGTARHAIPSNAAFDIVNGLLSEEDGSIFRRGGSSYLSTSALGASGLTTLWSGFLTPGSRELFANSSDFGTLDAAEAPVNLGLGGLSAPRKAVELAGLLVIGGGTVWGGSRKTAGYSTGTVAVTQGSKTVTGTGTDWDPNVDAGMLFQRGAGTRYYVVASRDSDTQITLRDAYEGATASGQSYSLSNIASFGAPYRVSDLYAVAADRLFSLEGNRAYFSEPGLPHTFDAAEGYHELPEGSQLVGGAGLGDRVLLFATSGLWLVSNLHFDLTDQAGGSQHRVEHISEEQLLLSHEGIATYRNALVAPCASGIWLIDGISAPVLISRPITALWREYVAAGHKCGLAQTYNSHLLLPVLSSANALVDVLVCRLDLKSRPWSRLAGFSANVAGFAVRTGGSASPRNPKLLAASMASTSRVLDCSTFFGPDVPAGADDEPDGSVHQLDVTTRDYPAGDGLRPATVRRARLRYELVDPAAANPTLAGYYSVGVRQSGVTTWGQFTWGQAPWSDSSLSEFVEMEGQAPESDGREPHWWDANRRAIFVRFRFRSSGPASRLVLRSLELLARPNRKL